MHIFHIARVANLAYRRVKSKGYMNGQLCCVFIGLPGLDILPGSRFLLLNWLNGVVCAMACRNG